MQVKEEKIKDRIEKLAQKKARIEFKEKLLKDKEREMKKRRFIEIGAVAVRFSFEGFDDQTLIGAFAELQERSKKEGVINEWRKKGEVLSKTSLSPLIVSFEKEISGEVRNGLKERKFKWNKFRKEWYGYGVKEEIENLIKASNGKVDISKG